LSVFCLPTDAFTHRPGTLFLQERKQARVAGRFPEHYKFAMKGKHWAKQANQIKQKGVST